MNREKTLTKIIGFLDKKLDSLRNSLKETEISAKQAPSAMESHSDTSRFQFGQLADNLRILIKKIEQLIKEIEKNETTTEYIGMGSVVKIKKDDTELYYYISSMGLEEPFSIDGREFRVISIDTPIVKCLFGKKVGESVEIKIPSGNYLIRILEIN